MPPRWCQLTSPIITFPLLLLTLILILLNPISHDSLNQFPTLFTRALSISISPRTPSSDHKSPFNFPDCVANCVGTSGCGLNEPRCMCRAAGGGSLLETVLSCMSFHCKSDLLDADDTLLTPMSDGCAAVGRPIPADALHEAEAFASSLTAGATATVTAPTPKTTLTPNTTPEGSSLPAVASTSTAGGDTSMMTVPDTATMTSWPGSTASKTSGQATATETSGSEGTGAVTGTTTEVVTASVSSTPTTTKTTPKFDTTDANPFATPNPAAQIVAAPGLWAGVPLAAVLAIG